MQYYHSGMIGQLLGLAIFPQVCLNRRLSAAAHHLHLMQTLSRLQPVDSAPRMDLVKLC